MTEISTHNVHRLMPRQTLDRMKDIARFNSTMSTADVIKLNNRLAQEDRDKHQLIETFTNQLYTYFLRRQGEYNKMTENLEKKMISKDGYDLCVNCGTKTIYKTERHIDTRRHYIEGAGQLCDPCGEALDKNITGGKTY
jgi:hypothetical protein